MGSRIGCHLANQEAVTGLVCLGYPLVAAGTGAVRDEVLLALSTPILFVQGTRDPLGPLDQLASVRSKMRSRNELHVVEGGNHSLEIPGGKATARMVVDGPRPPRPVQGIASEKACSSKRPPLRAPDAFSPTTG